MEVGTLTSSDMFAGRPSVRSSLRHHLRRLSAPSAMRFFWKEDACAGVSAGMWPAAIHLVGSSLPLVMFGRLAVAHDGELRARLASRSTDDLAQDGLQLLRRELRLGCEPRIWREGWAAVSPPREYFKHLFA